MGAHYLIFVASVAEIIITVVGFRWIHKMLKALASGIDTRFAHVDRVLRRPTEGGPMPEPR